MIVLVKYKLISYIIRTYMGCCAGQKKKPTQSEIPKIIQNSPENVIEPVTKSQVII